MDEPRSLIVVESGWLADTLQRMVRDDVLVTTPMAAMTGRRFDRIIVLSAPDTDVPRLRELVQHGMDDLTCKLTPGGTLMRASSLPHWLRLWV